MEIRRKGMIGNSLQTGHSSCRCCLECDQNKYDVKTRILNYSRDIPDIHICLLPFFIFSLQTWLYLEGLQHLTEQQLKVIVRWAAETLRVNLSQKAYLFVR